MSVAHGALEPGGYRRACWVCPGGWHGPLYACEHYPPDVLATIAEEDAAWRQQIQTPEFEAQVGPVAVAIYRWFAGVPIESNKAAKP